MGKSSESISAPTKATIEAEDNIKIIRNITQRINLTLAGEFINIPLNISEVEINHLLLIS
jgi:hypothetical protein